ncbi:MAG: fatty acid desaturase [Myxococcales bacterium]|nr:fatty acid desaturase [Myxococcales bacterium]
MSDTPVREGRALIDATRPYSEESRAKSLWHSLSTFLLVASGFASIVLVPEWWMKLPLALVTGLVVVRAFILYHDVMHGAILKKSALGRLLFAVYGILVLTPSRVWRDTHNYHHAHTAKLVGSHIGSYPTLSTDIYKALAPRQQFFYRAARHPLTILFAWLTVFLWGMCASSFKRSPSKYWESGVAIVVHLGLIALLGIYGGAELLVFAYLVPLNVAFIAGAYLFYAQHNFEGIHIQPRSEWSYTRAALESSSYMKSGALMEWFTGSIGFHHVHHLNPAIPFYRLEETMAAIPELQSPGMTSLSPAEIVRCFRLKLWDPKQGRMVGYPE